MALEGESRGWIKFITRSFARFYLLQMLLGLSNQRGSHKLSDTYRADEKFICGFGRET
jgi:hypothetical protein